MHALLTQQRISQKILTQGEQHLVIVKQDQPALYDAVALLFRLPPIPVRRGELLTDQTEGKDHGRLERRSLASSTALTDYLSWAGAAQVMRRTCRRRWTATNNWSSSGAAIGSSRIARPVFVTKPCMEITVRSTPAWRRRPWLPSAIPPWPCYVSMVGTTSRPPCAATPPIRTHCVCWAFPHCENTLAHSPGADLSAASVGAECARFRGVDHFGGGRTMRSAYGSQSASERGSAPKSRGGRRSVCWTIRAWGPAAAQPGSTAAQQAAKWGARGSVRPPAVACWRPSTGPTCQAAR